MGQYNCKYPAVVSETVALVARLIALTLASIATKSNTTVFILGLHLSVAQTVYRFAVIKSHFTHTAIHALAAAASAAIDLIMVTACSLMAWYKVVELMRELGLCEISDESDYCLDGDLGIWIIVINYCIFLMAMVVYHISAWRLVVGGVATADDAESQPLAIQSDTPTGLANVIVNHRSHIATHTSRVATSSQHLRARSSPPTAQKTHAYTATYSRSRQHRLKNSASENTPSHRLSPKPNHMFLDNRKQTAAHARLCQEATFPPDCVQWKGYRQLAHGRSARFDTTLSVRMPNAPRIQNQIGNERFSNTRHGQNNMCEER